MADDKKLNSFTSQLQSLMEIQADFPQRLKQRLVFESNKVTNPFKFIGGLLSKGVLCDGSNDSETNFGLKEWMVQLAVMLASSKGADAVGGMMEALEESGNLALISALRTWVKEDFGIESDGDLSFGFLSSEPKGDVFDGVKIPSSELLPEQGKNESSLIPSCVDKQTEEEPRAVMTADFFGKPASPDGLEKVATFNCHAGSTPKEAFVMEFDMEKLVAHFSDGTQQMWNWIDRQEKAIKYGDKVKIPERITSLQHDEEILVLGTAEGTVYLFDAKSFQAKWSVRLGGPVLSLKFIDFTLLVLTRGNDGDKFWWVEISRPYMRLFIQMPFPAATKVQNSGFFMDPVYSFMYNSNRITVQHTTSGIFVLDGFLEAPAEITTLSVVDLISTGRNIIAGCRNGAIALWTTFLNDSADPVKTFKGHREGIVALCAINGHLLSVDVSGKLLMWSGHDLENTNVDAPAPRVLGENFHNVTALVAHERWFASCSAEDGVINIYTLPDLWLRTG